jgi:glycosyltransferase involved in cell wall biosynthesis
VQLESDKPLGGTRPQLSVIVPVRNDAGHLHECLKSLQASRYSNFEIIVVDDASTDQTPEVPGQFGVRLERMPRQAGPAAARNRGADVSQGEYLLFLDADVCVHPETVGLAVEALSQNPSVDAVFGSYDARPGAPNVLSQYRNLMHHFVHQNGSSQATTFWAGCGAIRRSVFLAMGGFDAQTYRRPCIEDIELGARMVKAGHRIVLDKRILVTHLKRWTLSNMLRADIRDRALPWTALILREGSLPNDLNLKLSQRISTLLAFALAGTILAGAWYIHPMVLLLPVAILAVIALIDRWSLDRRVPTAVRFLALCGLVTTVITMAVYLKWLVLIPSTLLIWIILLNLKFYAFLARQRHPLFAALAIPLHVLYFLYSGLAFLTGVACHYGKSLLVQPFRAKRCGSDRQGTPPSPITLTN